MTVATVTVRVGDIIKDRQGRQGSRCVIIDATPKAEVFYWLVGAHKGKRGAPSGGIETILAATGNGDWYVEGRATREESAVAGILSRDDTPSGAKSAVAARPRWECARVRR